MADANERMAVIENELTHFKGDVTQLFKLMREHMRTDEEYMKKTAETHDELLAEIRRIDTNMSKHKSFIGGIIFTVTAVWSMATAVAYWIIQIKHS